MKCKLCSMEGNYVFTDEQGFLTHYCEHHAPKGSEKLNKSKYESFIKKLKTYKILFVIFLIILFYIGIRYILIPDSSPEKIMNDFMAGFFLSFGILQIKTLSSTKETLKKYDPLAKRFPWYAEIYSFILLFFGLALHTNSIPVLVSTITILIFGIQTYGIINVLKKGEKVECACAGTKYSLPLSYVTVVENGIMILMSLFMIIINFL